MEYQHTSRKYNEKKVTCYKISKENTVSKNNLNVSTFGFSEENYVTL